MHLLAAQAGAFQQEGEAIDLAQSPGAASSSPRPPIAN